MGSTRETVFTVTSSRLAYPHFIDTYSGWIISACIVVGIIFSLVTLFLLLDKKMSAFVTFALTAVCFLAAGGVMTVKVDPSDEIRKEIVSASSSNRDVISTVAHRHMFKHGIDYNKVCDDNPKSVICGGDDLSSISAVGANKDSYRVMLYPDYQNYPDYRTTGTVGVVFTVIGN